MNAELQSRLNLFLENRDAMKQGFRWEYGMMHCLAALLYTQKGMLIDPASVRASRKALRKRFGLFSTFRGAAELAFATLLSLADEPQDSIDDAELLYRDLRRAGFSSSQYLAIAAFLCAGRVDSGDGGLFAGKAYALYRQLRTAHPWLASSEEATAAALLSLVPGEHADEIERCYTLLRTRFPSRTASYKLACLLAASGAPYSEKCDCAFALADGLREQGVHVPASQRELSSLGAAVLVHQPTDALVDSIVEVDAALRAERGFNAWGVGRAQRFSFAVSLAVLPYLDSMQQRALSGALTNTITAIVIASQVAATAAAASAATAASSS